MPVINPPPVWQASDPIPAEGVLNTNSLHVGYFSVWGDTHTPLTVADINYIKAVGMPPTGVSLGLTQGPASFGLQIPTNEYTYEADFAPSVQGRRLHSIDAQFTLLSLGLDYGNFLRKFFSGGALDDFGELGVPINGGVPARSLTLISESTCSPSVLIVSIYHFKCEGFSFAGEKNKESTMNVRVTGLMRRIDGNPVGIGRIYGTEMDAGVPSFPPAGFVINPCYI